MRKLVTTVLFLLALGYPGSAHAERKGHMLPLEEEKLSKPLFLTGSCRQVKVVEWRPAKGWEQSTGYSPVALDVLNDICQTVLAKFPVFVIKKGYQINTDFVFTQNISLIPGTRKYNGFGYRNLNDVKYRFLNRSKEYDEFGEVYPIWGYFHRDASYIYIRNDVLNEDMTVNLKFKTVFAHELFHALSYQYDIYNQHRGNKDQVDEELSQKFTEYLGLGR